MEGEYHWHKHDNDDEVFFVLKGKLLIDLKDQVIELNPDEGVTIERCNAQTACSSKNCDADG